ncbi:hypothetical protein [Paraburkholderia phenoliruptrix]|uniref:hypothetical protein n=1 Tax=Paraburkholderia phenoliruptrix TaxID=252970 RepID=UPI001C6DE027|nr:hypothetical protein [Paraburkholderia phenoliruptrix]MBW9102949.1 hypothetical protein [Paraburkholderia phenoliruptrix]MBW9132923.1 hypothetical protein [Paraburkholderia ginsengiterrae]
MASPTGRSAMRKLVVAALQATATAPTIQSPGDWSVPPAKLPAILVRCGDEQKTSLGPVGETEFNTDFVIEIRGIVSGATAEAAQDALEDLGATIEDVVLRNIGIRKVTQDFPRITSATEIKSDGQLHFGAVSIAMHFQIFEAFDPDVTTSLQEMSLTADLRNVYDPNGTYPNPPFPDSVQPAPRTSGPDGRAEGGFDIELPQ